MTGLRTRLLPSLLMGLVLASLAGCSGSSEPTDRAASGQSALKTKTATAGPVEVRVTPRRLTGRSASFDVVLDNHEIELTGDYAAGSTLQVAGQQWGPATWSGDGPGGHHRQGVLSFAASASSTGPVTLRIGNLPAPVALTWAGPR